MRLRHEAPYDTWAEYYDLTDADRKPYIDFYRSLVTTDTRSLLELGCGTGTIAHALKHAMPRRAGSPARVVGMDESSGMLRVARRNQPDAFWVRGDLRALPFRGNFDLVICCFNTLQHVVELDDLVRAFSQVREIVGFAGRFAFDVYQPNLTYLRTPQFNRLARSLVDGEGCRLEIREDTAYDASSRILTIDWRLMRSDQSGPPLAVTRYPLRQYFAEDITNALGRAGLRLYERYGSFDRSPFTPLSKKQVIVCGR